MAERPILFSGPLVRAILAGKKSVTRRVVKPQPVPCHGAYAWASAKARLPGSGPIGTLTLRDIADRCPYGAPGDVLWCKETHYVERAGYPDGRGRHVIYRADDENAPIAKWTPSIHMPHWASRLSLLVKDVRVERLQEISGADARAEGVTLPVRDGHVLLTISHKLSPFDFDPKGPREWTIDDYWRFSFAMAWHDINGKTHSWSSNPWVWRIEFERLSPDDAKSLAVAEAALGRNEA